MKTAWAYARFSSDHQREESIDAQLWAIQDYCQRSGYVLTNIYRDEARSATTDDRPQFQQMFKDISCTPPDIVIVHKLDRFSRDRYDSAFYKKKLKAHSISYRSDSAAELESLKKELAKEQKGLDVDGTKSKNAARYVPIPQEILDEVKKINIDPFEFLFTSKNGTPLNKESIRRRWKAIKREMHIQAGGAVYRNAIIEPFMAADDLTMPQDC